MVDIQNFIVLFLISALTVQHLLDAWFETQFKLVLFAKWYPKATSAKDIEESWMMNPPFGSWRLADLLVCPVCIGTWISLFVCTAVYCFSLQYLSINVPLLLISFPAVCWTQRYIR